MQTLAQILAGAGGNPYQNAGGGIAPLLQQLIQAQQPPGLVTADGQPDMTTRQFGVPNTPTMTSMPTGLGMVGAQPLVPGFY